MLLLVCVDSIFLDEASADCAYAKFYYVILDVRAKAKGGEAILNLGTQISEYYIQSPTPASLSRALTESTPAATRRRAG